MRQQEKAGHVRRAGTAAPARSRGQRVIRWEITAAGRCLLTSPAWHLNKGRPALAKGPARLSAERRATEQAITLTSRRIALLRREISALAKMEEGIEELEQVEREMAPQESVPSELRR